MATNFPTSIDTLVNPTSSDGLNNPDHAAQHANANDAIEAIQAKVGANSSAVTTSHDYKLGEVTGSDKSVGKTATQTLTNKTLTSPQINMASNATGDMYYRDSGGTTVRLPAGSANQILSTSSSGIPEWIANPAAADASTTVKGVVEEATVAQINEGTGTGETGARLFMSPENFASSDLNISTTDVQTFTTNDTWTKPAGAKSVKVQAWGGGGGGGGSASASGGGGGGGGGYSEWTFDADDLGATESVVVGAGGTAGSNQTGGVGGNSTFDIVIAYGGGGGVTNNGGGGGGGGNASAGATGSTTNGGAGGGLSAGAGNGGDSVAGGGGGRNATSSSAGGTSTFGGGGGGGGTGASLGGASIFGGGGGGGGDTSSRAGGTSRFGGAGGQSNNGSNGAAGSVRGGGGGGSYAATFAGGAGGRGEVVVTTYF